MPIDYMHCVLQGVCKRLTSLWFNSRNHTNPGYIGRKRDLVDSRLAIIKPPSEISRAPGLISKLSDWKGFTLSAAIDYCTHSSMQLIMCNDYNAYSVSDKLTKLVVVPGQPRTDLSVVRC